ncbi:tRNA (adenine-N(1)-)-methyltransferase catalytic subunit trm61 [Entomophthora muscae]|uniref:tRNA (Adenine-N(1)-)-methyltransferase catalytic subunit trm61 n=1 Tax=Entomophthora muscae TaxID=34485 RepID=A0ACC2SI92_9FUNG|nr:tRNA (adenine-N(1)-)-methyltransferase catalytic subunit trm61 [Entomophthora muscae]
MSFSGYKNIIEEGDTVILYFNREVAFFAQVKTGDLFSCRFGSYKHEDMIGQPFGLKLTSHTGRGFVYLLHPTPELWTLVVPHRTQIIYTADIAFISTYLDLKPGVKVIESGTGSGSFSHSIARTIGQTGHLYTFEYHLERSELARAEFLLHGLQDGVTVQNRDVCKDGFGLDNEVDAVFLDLPAPWEAVESAKKAIKKNTTGRICTFSPCIEQVQRSCAALAENGFTEICTFECLTRGYESKSVAMPTLDQAIRNLKTKVLKRKADKSQAYGQKRDKDVNGSENDSPEEDSLVPVKSVNSLPVSKPVLDLRGHTSYLTFAVLPPVFFEN